MRKALSTRLPSQRISSTQPQRNGIAFERPALKKSRITLGNLLATAVMVAIVAVIAVGDMAAQVPSDRIAGNVTLSSDSAGPLTNSWDAPDR